MDCPYSTNGEPTRPVVAEYPENPRWILVGEGPGRTEVQLNRPFQGSAQLVEKMLGKIGRRRNEIALTTAVLCVAPARADGQMTSDIDRERASTACKGRLQQELAQWPGMPVLTLGAVAARAVIPKATLEAIDPPNVPKSKKRSQKERQKAEAKALKKAMKADQRVADKRQREIGVIAKGLFKQLENYQREKIRAKAMRPERGQLRPKKKPTKAWTDNEMQRYLEPLRKKAAADAVIRWELTVNERRMQDAFEEANPKPIKPKKPKQIKITDIMSTCFEVDVDGTGVLRPVIPSIHPGSLLRGGGATIGGTHTPDLAFVNLYYDASKVDALSQGKDVRLNLDVDIEVADKDRTGWMVRDALDRAFAEGEVSIDLETYVDDVERHHALMAYMARIRTIGLSTNDKTISVMWEHVPGWALSYLALALAHPNVTKTFHNGLYDRTVLAANGFTVDGPWEDTLLGHHAAFPGCAHRLQSVTAQFFAVPPWKSEFRNAEETPEGLTKYNAVDTGATHALRPAMTLWIKRTKTERIYAIDKKMAEVASKMHLAGMPVSRERNSEMLKTFSHNVVESKRAVEAIADSPALRKELYHYLCLQQAVKPRKNDPSEWTKSDGETVHGFEARYEKRLSEIVKDTSWKWKIGASKHIAALIQAMGQPLVQKTDSGQTSTKKDILESLAHVQVVRDILTFRENDKLNSTFVWQIFDRFDKYGQQIQWGYADDNDRIHPIWTIHKITGRWASSEPVVSNVPKDRWKTVDAEKASSLIWEPSKDGLKFTSVDEHGVPWRKDERGRCSYQSRPNLRGQIVAPHGRIFVGFDYAQLEARVIALISGDPFLCATFAEGKDIHTECARVVFPAFDTLSKDDRKQARDVTKNFEYGAFYGGSIDTLWKTLLKAGYMLKLVDVARAVAVLMAKMVGVVRWQRETVAQAQLPPYEVKDFLLGRRRTFPLGQVEATEAMNFGVQAAGSAIMNTGMAIADDGLRNYKEAFAIAQIHDAAVFECWEDDAERLAKDVDVWFHQEYERDGRKVPFPVEVKINKSWAGV